MATDLRIEGVASPDGLADIGEALGKAGVNIEGFCVSGDRRAGSVHLLVEDARAATHALEEAGYGVAAERGAVVLPGVENRPGFVGELARRLAEASVVVDAAYLATHTRLVFVVDDVDAARQAL